MPLRRLINLAASHLFDGLDESTQARLIGLLRLPFEHEATTDQQRRDLEYQRMALETGAADGQQALMDAFGMEPA